MQNPAHILCLQEDSILTIQINRPDKKNALDQAMYFQMTQALKEAQSQESIKVVIITGTESCFCAGNDLSDFLKVKTKQDLKHIFEFLYTISEFPKPIIAAVNGVAIGIGTTLLLHCDLVVADQTSVFQLPFVNLGACPEGGSSLLLPQIMGLHKANELLMLGEKFNAESAAKLGLVNEISPKTKALEMAISKAQHLATKPTQALQTTKTLLRKPFLKNMKAIIDEEAECFFNCLKTPESQQTIQKFFQQK